MLTFLVGCSGGCKGPNLEPGGAYSPATTNELGEVTLTTEPERALYVSDAAYKFAYTAIFNVFKLERDNRAEFAKISPEIKNGLDKIRPIAVDIDQRWARARKAYKDNPTPAGLDTIQRIISEIQRLLPVAQAELKPVFTSVTNTNQPN